MRKKYLIGIFIYLFLHIFFLSNTFAKINSSIIVKVGNQIITNSDLEDEVKTLLVLSNKQVNQENIDEVKNFAVKSLIRKLIKKSEISKKKEKRYNPEELENYLLKVSNSLKISRSELKNFFKKNNLNYESFIEKSKVELIWKTLIYTIYKNQIAINTIEVDNEIKERLKNRKNSVEYELSEIEISSNNSSIESLIEEIYKTIKIDGFEKAAKKFSISNSSSRGGRMGFFPEKTLSSIYLNELKKIKTGEITKPIRTSNSIIILKIESINFKEKENINLAKLKEEIINKKREEKLELFSRSHFTNIENLTLIKFQ